jgi:hypothetical protein
MSTNRSRNTVGVLRHAALLFAAAGDHPTVSPSVQLYCHAAIAELGVGTGLTDVVVPAEAGVDWLIGNALRQLGSLPFEVFDDPGIRAAARFGRRALSGRP